MTGYSAISATYQPGFSLLNLAKRTEMRLTSAGWQEILKSTKDESAQLKLQFSAPLVSCDDHRFIEVSTRKTTKSQMCFKGRRHLGFVDSETGQEGFLRLPEECEIASVGFKGMLVARRTDGRMPVFAMVSR